MLNSGIKICYFIDISFGGEKMKKLILLLIFLQISISAEFVVGGYVPTYRWAVLDKLDYKYITHLFASFANPDSTGKIFIGADIDDFVRKCHENDVKAMVSIGGGGDYSWGDDYKIYEKFIDDTARTWFVSQWMNYVRLHDLDGIDVDLEGYALKLANYNVFVQELADSLHGAGLEVTAASGIDDATYISDATAQKYDFIMTMSYGGIGSWNWNKPQHPSTFDKFSDDIQYWINRGLDQSKVVGGVPFYGVEFPFTSQTSYGSFHHTFSTLYTESEYREQDPFNHDTIFSAEDHPIYLNSFRTLKEKIAYADSAAGGFMIWEIGQDSYSSGPRMTDSLWAFMDDNNIGDPKVAVYDIGGIGVAPSSISYDMFAKGNRLKVYDVSGRLIFNSSQAKKSDLNKLSSGIYLLRAIKKSGKVIERKHFVK